MASMTSYCVMRSASNPPSTSGSFIRRRPLLVRRSTEEAGRLLGIKANTVRVLTTRARASLKLTLEDPS